MFIRKFRKLTVKMDKLPCFEKKFIGLHLHSILPLWTDNAFATTGLLTRPQIPRLQQKPKRPFSAHLGPLPCFLFLCFLSSVNYTDRNILHLIWEKSSKAFFIFASESLITVDLRFKAGTGGHKQNSHGKVCVSLQRKTFPLQLIMPLNVCVCGES